MILHKHPNPLHFCNCICFLRKLSRLQTFPPFGKVLRASKESEKIDGSAPHGTLGVRRTLRVPRDAL